MTATRSPGELYQSAACGLLSTSFQGTIEHVNATFCSWLGFSSGELVGQRRFQELLTVGSKIFHQTHWLPLLQMQGAVAEVQFEFVHRDGRTMAALVNAQLAGGAVTRGAVTSGAVTRGAVTRGTVTSGSGPIATPIDLAIFVASDRRKYERELLLARRKAEELLERVEEREAEFRTLAENSPDVIARFDRDNRYLYLNHLRQGDGTVDRFLGKTLDEVGLEAHVAASLKQGLAAAFRGEAATVSFPYRALEGRLYELQAQVVPERNGRGEITTALAITRDVSAMRAQQEEASQRAVLAEQLVGIVSHDLRNPLNAVLLGTRLLRSSPLAPAHGRAVTRISSAAERATRLVSDLLDFTQARLGGGLRVARKTIDLHGVIAACLDEIRLAHPGRMLEHRTIGSGAGLGDADRIAQVVGNLASNALTYGTADQPVTISTAVTDSALEVCVHNAGPPIPADLHVHLFEPLRRGEHSVQLGSRSVGLGLYIVNEIARALGGHVSVRSTEEEGTTFTVTLPRE